MNPEQLIGFQLNRIFNEAADSLARVARARGKLASGIYDSNPRIARITAERLQADLLDHDHEIAQEMELDREGWDG
jgi:hypothetical protein